MTKSNASPSDASPSSSDNDNNNNNNNNSVKCERKKKSIFPKMFKRQVAKDISSDDEDNVGPSSDDYHQDLPTIREKKAFLEQPSTFRKNVASGARSARIEGLNLSNFDDSIMPTTIVQDIRIFVGTWNVGGNPPTQGLNLEQFLQVEGSADIYVVGFQEIVPLNAGNVLVAEDNEPASRWLAIISYALNKPYHESIGSCCIDSSGGGGGSTNSNSHSKSNFFHKASIKLLTKNIRANNARLKSCNCNTESINPTRKPRKLSDPTSKSTFPSDSTVDNNKFASIIEEFTDTAPANLSYQLIASKQMVGLYLTIWSRKELVRHIGHLRVDSVGRGIMGRLGNKGCISISMTLHQTTFCFICSHLASGEKEGDELRRNVDVTEILKHTQFPSVCKNSRRQIPERIIGHDRIIWLGDLNYRVALSYEETRHLLEDNDWDSLLKRDQLILEKQAGRVFVGFSEGKILFAPTYKYTHNSDSYAGETVKSKKKRRTPAWCDRILWLGSGIEQLSYIRGESRFSDHRPVCAVFAVEVEMKSKHSKFRKGYSCAATKSVYEDCLPPRHSFCE